MTHTPGPWKWQVQDYSMASLEGLKGMEDGVMAVSPCGSCQKGAKRDGEWKWGRCQTPTLANARLIAAAPELLEALRAVAGDESNTAYPLGIKPWLVIETILKVQAAIAKAEGK